MRCNFQHPFNSFVESLTNEGTSWEEWNHFVRVLRPFLGLLIKFTRTRMSLRKTDILLNFVLLSEISCFWKQKFLQILKTVTLPSLLKALLITINPFLEVPLDGYYILFLEMEKILHFNFNNT